MDIFRRIFRRPADPRAEQGATAIEFALISIPLFVLLMGTVEFGLVMFVQTVLEGATNTGARLGKTGTTTNGLTREQYIRQQVVSQTGGLLDPSKIIITLKPYSSYDTSGTPSAEPCITASPCNGGQAGVNYKDLNGNGQYDAVRTDAGLGGDVVVYVTTYSWPLKTPLVSKIIGDSNGNFAITAVSTVRNEPF